MIFYHHDAPLKFGVSFNLEIMKHRRKLSQPTLPSYRESKHSLSEYGKLQGTGFVSASMKKWRSPLRKAGSPRPILNSYTALPSKKINKRKKSNPCIPSYKFSSISVSSCTWYIYFIALRALESEVGTRIPKSSRKKCE